MESPKLPSNLKEIQTDLLDFDYGIILHGVNCQRVMGSGVAKAIKDRYFIVYESYLQNEPVLGGIHFVPLNPAFGVVNGYTQYHYGRDGKKYADRIAIRNVLEKTVALSRVLNWKTISLPRIGSGLGGLDWKTEVLPEIAYVAGQNPNITFNVCYKENT